MSYEDMFSKNLKELMLERCMTTDQLSVLAEIPKIVVQRLFDGKIAPTLTEIMSICDLMRVTPNRLILGEMMEESPKDPQIDVIEIVRDTLLSGVLDETLQTVQTRLDERKSGWQIDSLRQSLTS